MKLIEQILFPPFHLDPVNEQLWREDQLVPLPPKTFAVLRYLVEHAGRLVTKEELLKAVWPDTRVSDGILKGYIRDLRDALGDSSHHPRFIETMPRRGHRFVGEVVSSQHSVVSSKEEARGWELEASPSFPQVSSLKPLVSRIVGREVELAHLHRLFEKAMTGERQMVFVTGEPGIGKTTLVENFLLGVGGLGLGVGLSTPTQPQRNPGTTSLSPIPNSQSLTPGMGVGRGQCVEQHGAGEAYLPVLEALSRIGRSPDGGQLVTVLQQYAPTWLVQMPALVAAAELEALQRRVMGASRERMLREMVEAIEVLTAQCPLVLWFEDLHWADASTVDWLAAIAQQTTAARLLVIGTYRPSDLSLSNHPLRAVKQELIAKGQSEELLLPFLSVDNVTQYLTQRYARHDFPSALGTAIHHSTDGNPLFVVNIVDYLNAQGVITEIDGYWHLQSPVEDIALSVPDSVRQLIEKQVERLSEEQQQLLEVASVAGVTFSTPAVAVGLEVPVEKVEKSCDGLVKRGQFLQTQEPRMLPDGTLCGSYGFQHALQHAVVYERIPQLRRLRLHRCIGESQERHYGEHVNLIAAELAMHFERGGNAHRAVQYCQQAGHNALRQHGYQEAITHFRRGLDLLATLPDTPERKQQELALQVVLGSPLQALHGYGAPEVEAVYTRARALCQQIGESAQLFPVLRGLYIFYLLRGKVQTAHELAERLLGLAQSVQDPAFLLEAHFAVGQALVFRGQLVAARAHLEQGIALYDPAQHRAHAFLYGQDPGVFCRLLAAWSLFFLGYPDQALKRNQEALTVAQEVNHPLSLAAAQAFFAFTHQLRREAHATQEHAEIAAKLSAQQGFTYFLAVSTLVRGWALADQGFTQEGVAQVREGFAAYRATGTGLVTIRFTVLLAEALGKAGQPEEGLYALAEALAAVDPEGPRDYEAELYRLRGELALAGARGRGLGIGEEENQNAKVKTQKPVLSKVEGSKRKPNPQPPTPNTQAEADAEAYFHKALTIAQQQQAKSLELRAVMSLVRLRQQQAMLTSRNTQHAIRAKLDEEHQLLVRVYNWFTEGFETKDLQDAKAVLDELG